jgi:hypothetical protein
VHEAQRAANRIPTITQAVSQGRRKALHMTFTSCRATSPARRVDYRAS